MTYWFTGILCHLESKEGERLLPTKTGNSCWPLKTSVKTDNFDPPTMTVDHPPPVPTMSCRVLRVLSRVLFLNRSRCTVITTPIFWPNSFVISSKFMTSLDYHKSWFTVNVSVQEGEGTFTGVTWRQSSVGKKYTNDDETSVRVSYGVPYLKVSGSLFGSGTRTRTNKEGTRFTFVYTKERGLIHFVKRNVFLQERRFGSSEPNQRLPTEVEHHSSLFSNIYESSPLVIRGPVHSLGKNFWITHDGDLENGHAFFTFLLCPPSLLLVCRSGRVVPSSFGYIGRHFHEGGKDPFRKSWVVEKV